MFTIFATILRRLRVWRGSLGLRSPQGEARLAGLEGAEDYLGLCESLSEAASRFAELDFGLAAKIAVVSVGWPVSITEQR